MSKEIINNTNKSVISNIIVQTLQQGTALIFSIVLARLLSPAEFGAVALANMIIYYSNNFTNFGFNNALVQGDNITKSHINSVFTIDLIISLVLATLTILFAPQLADFFHNPELHKIIAWMALYYVISTFYYIPFAILRRNIDFHYLALLTFLQSLLIYIASIVMAYLGFSYWSIVIPTLFFTALSCPVMMYKTKWHPRIRYSHKDMREIYNFGMWNFIRTQINLLAGKIDYFVIGRYLDISSLGIYQKAFELSERSLTGISTPINGIYFSTFSRLKDDLAEVKRVFLEASATLALLCYPILFGFMAVANHFVHSCLGEQWSEAVLPIQILSSACLLRVLLGTIASANIGIGKYRLHTILKFVSAIFFMILCFTVVKQGIIAICWAFFAFNVFEFIGSFWIVSRTINVSFIDLLRAIWCPLVGAAIMFFIVKYFALNLIIDIYSLSHLVWLVLIGISFYLGWSGVFYKLGVVRLRIMG
jgi:O-antigen/teichoic acid export membrane protein